MTGLLITGRMIDPRGRVAPGWIAIEGGRVAAAVPQACPTWNTTALAPLEPGAPADLVLFGEAGETVRVLRLGRWLEPSQAGEE